ncbi:hypothetical protein CAPTEDRAFT_102830 [Capitella teleta]|uniref:Transcriptional coactivator p15 (PC4) C-terminal domain-containing protein n=1 Tax=Capitella teleta TaxID=283909 RepID=R7U562_CAPTE|nr:hypothetical protein CAPTEDRAFT_102830 [Capitella teleta]|eukprot:ELT98290.1 hypothetical protein CAPTEDRAFT_102830 [Capitella teleta]
MFYTLYDLYYYYVYNHGFQIAKNRYVTISEFKGKKYVNIREYYDADGEMKPGRKGIALNSEQWANLKEHIDDIDKALDKL